VPLWLADPTQTSVPSWLTSPTVALLGFVATVASLLQSTVAVGKWFMKRTEKLSNRRRAAIAASVLCFIATAIISPLTWSTIVAIDARSDPLYLAELYPVMTTASAFAGASLLLNFSARVERRLILSASLLIFIGLAFPTAVYAISIKSMWDVLLVATIPGISIAAVVFSATAHLRSKAQNAHAEDSSVVGAGSAALFGPGIGSPDSVLRYLRMAGCRVNATPTQATAELPNASTGGTPWTLPRRAN
jgi:hypothetical protein